MSSKDEVGNPRVPLSIKLLRAYYPRVSSILDYILAICRVSSQNESLAFDDLKGHLLREDDFQGYKELLLFGVVGYEKLRDVKFEASPASMSLCDVRTPLVAIAPPSDRNIQGNRQITRENTHEGRRESQQHYYPRIQTSKRFKWLN